MIIPSQDCILEIRGAQDLGDISICGIVSTGRPKQNGVISGDLFAFESPISSTIAAAYPSCEILKVIEPSVEVCQSNFIPKYHSACEYTANTQCA